jgi:hypothetical protein
VGRDYEWRDRFDRPRTTPPRSQPSCGDPDVEIWVAYARGWPQGFFMLDWREAGTCDLAYFGLVPQAVGTGLGGRCCGPRLPRDGRGRAWREDDRQHLHARSPARAGRSIRRWVSPVRPGRPHRVLAVTTATRPTSGLKGTQPMFETLAARRADKILRLMGMFAADPRPDKVDLGVGVYRSPEGRSRRSWPP